jgi:hypothetical protein
MASILLTLGIAISFIALEVWIFGQIDKEEIRADDFKDY